MDTGQWSQNAKFFLHWGTENRWNWGRKWEWGMWKVDLKKMNVEHRTSNIERPTSNVEWEKVNIRPQSSWLWSKPWGHDIRTCDLNIQVNINPTHYAWQAGVDLSKYACSTWSADYFKNLRLWSFGYFRNVLRISHNNRCGDDIILRHSHGF